MPFVLLAIRFAFRNRLRSLLTALGVGITLLAFLVLRTLVASWYSVNEEAAATDRMIIRHKVAITFPLFTPQAEKIRAVPGVRDVSWMSWLGGVYKDERENFGQLAVDGESYLRIYPEFRPPPEQLQAWLGDPTGAIAGAALANRFGWKIGERIVLRGTYYAGDWELTLRGIYPGTTEKTDTGLLFMHWKYLNDQLAGGEHVQRLIALVDGPSVANAIDEIFAGSQVPTKTESELSVQRDWASWSSAIVAAIDVASGLILLVLVLVLGNGIAMATRESTREYAAMRAIGYRPRHIIALVLGEGFAVALLGITASLVVAPTVLEAFARIMASQLGGVWELELDPVVTALAALTGLISSMLAAAWPAWRSGRLRIVDALRRAG